MRLKGKSILVTGGGTGIGKALAERFAAEGAKVVITGRRKEKLEKVASGLPSGSVEICQGDVTNQDEAKKMVDATIAFGGSIDVLVNNAGIDPAGSITDIDPDLWRQVIEINLTGPFLMMKATIPRMIESGGGSIINIASLAGLRCIPAMPAYASSKAGLIMLSKQTALDYGPQKIRCNVVCPGATRTEMFENSLTPLCDVMKTDLNGVFDRVTSTTPLRRVANPEEMSGVCVFLSSDDSAYMTGSVLLLDGGAAVVDPIGAVVVNAGIGWGGA